MQQRYQDSMALVTKFGKADLFVTMTCNPKWREIRETMAELPGGAVCSVNRPDIIARVFRNKLDALQKDIINEQVLGATVAFLYGVEFQKRGLPHAHILIFFHDDDKLRSPDDYDKVICAEIPDEVEFGNLYNVIKKCMVHGPCGSLNWNAPCMDKGKCTKGYPKLFVEQTHNSADGYPMYRRRDDGRQICIKKGAVEYVVDNRWIVPYNRCLSNKYDCHTNVEYCASILSVK